MRLPPMYSPGFASPEHYAPGRQHLGPWSDIYSVGASLYACLAAAGPQPADQRLENDRYQPARKQWAGKYSNELLDTIDWCMRLDHLERPQSVFALQKTLLGEKKPDHTGQGPVTEGLGGRIGAGLRGAFSRITGRGARNDEGEGGA